QAELITINHDWNDLILPPETIHQLREIYLRIKHRARVFELWGLGKKVVAKHGLSVLFAGPSGTGKTMAAGIIANGLGQDLYRVDLSTMVSKYIGETEKNLNKIFEAAEQSNAVLFFDEADAIFGKRSDVKDSHDRYANLQVAYLLQRMETFSGIAILATNLIANTDDAFIRRLDFIVAFPEPEANQRKQIWQHHLESSGKLPLGSIDYQFLADHFHMTGGLIRNAVVHAAFLAAEDGGVVQMIHLLQAVKREYQKQRRLVDEALFAEFTPASPEL
ncbi:MAG: ATP-binding protein, partial [Chloroflexota bacterium]